MTPGFLMLSVWARDALFWQSHPSSKLTSPSLERKRDIIDLALETYGGIDQ